MDGLAGAAAWDRGAGAMARPGVVVEGGTQEFEQSQAAPSSPQQPPANSITGRIPGTPGSPQQPMRQPRAVPGKAASPQQTPFAHVSHDVTGACEAQLRAGEPPRRSCSEGE